MLVYYCDTFPLPLPAGHRFPAEKYRLLREKLLAEGIITAADLRIPEAASERELNRAHEPDYVRRVIAGQLSAAEIRRIGFPWTPQLVERSRRSVGATLAVARAALDDGFAASTAGGTHHAGRAFGEGYCVFNDVVVAARALQDEGRIRRAVIIDLDVHQGNGTAEITVDDPSLFTFSVHGEKNFPLRKFPSDLDVPLPDGTADDAYLAATATGLKQALEAATQADLAIYLAGADPHEGDRLGRLKVSANGLASRDRLVFDACTQAGLPVAIVMSGGYGADIRETVDIQFHTIAEAARRCRQIR